MPLVLRGAGVAAFHEVVASTAQEVAPLLDQEVDDGEVANEEDAGHGQGQEAEALEAAVEGVEEEDGPAEETENVQAVDDHPGHHEAPSPGNTIKH